MQTKFFIAVLVILLACNQADKRKVFTNEEGLLVKRWFFPDSTTIKRERTYLNDTILHGYAKEYFPNGQLHVFKEIKEGIKHGREIDYFSNGQIKVEGTNFDGKRNGKWVWYDSLGNIKQKTRYDLGVLCGEQLNYKSSGDKTQLTECYCFVPEENGAYQYHSMYDDLGSKESEDGYGSPILIFKSTTFPNQKVGDSLIVRIFLCPCVTSKNAIVTLNDSKNGDTLDSLTLKEGDFFTYRYKLLQKGTFEFKIMQGDSTVNQIIQVD